MGYKIKLKELVRKNRINQSDELILKNGLSGKMSNTKWHELFELLEFINCEFRIKLITDREDISNKDWNKQVIELTQDSILSDNCKEYGFIEFKEIAQLDILVLKNFNHVFKEIKAITSSIVEATSKISVIGY